MSRRGGQAGFRAALIEHRRKFAERWPTPGSREMLAAVERGDDILLGADTMLSLTGDPRYGWLNGVDGDGVWLLVGDRLTRLPFHG